LAQSTACALLSDTTGNHTLFRYNPNLSRYSRAADVGGVIPNLTFTPNTVWKVSENCDRFSVDNFIFSAAPNNQSVYHPLNNNFTTFIWTAIDRNLTTATFNGGVWRLSPNTNAFTPFISNISLVAFNSVYVFGPRILIAATNSTVARVFAYNDLGVGVPTLCLNYSLGGFQN